MQFDRKQMLYIWEQLRGWDKVSETQFCHHYNTHTQALEIYIFFLTPHGLDLRFDYEVGVSQVAGYTTPYIYNWTNKDIDLMLNVAKEMIYADLEDWQVLK